MARGEHNAATLEPDPWQDPTFGQIVWLATVFGCESFSVGEDDPTTAWNTLQAWWQERDPHMPFGSETPHPAPVGPLVEALGPVVGPSPGEFFLNSLLTAEFRWSFFDNQASALLDLGNFFTLLPTTDGARRPRCKAAAVAWCWVMQEVPPGTSSSPCLPIPLPTLVFLMDRLQPQTGMAQGSRKHLAVEARHLSLGWWIQCTSLVRLVTVHCTRHARPGSAWEESAELHPAKDGLG